MERFYIEMNGTWAVYDRECHFSPIDCGHDREHAEKVAAAMNAGYADALRKR